MHISLKVSDKVGRKEVVTSVDSVSQRADVPNTIVETGADSSDAPRGEGDGNDSMPGGGRQVLRYVSEYLFFGRP